MRRLLLLLSFAAVVVQAIPTVRVRCDEDKFFNAETRECETCTTCGDFMYERESCSDETNTVCGWCGSHSVTYNDDFQLKCRNAGTQFQSAITDHLRSKLMRQFVITRNALQHMEQSKGLESLEEEAMREEISDQLRIPEEDIESAQVEDDKTDYEDEEDLIEMEEDEEEDTEQDEMDVARAIETERIMKQIEKELGTLESLKTMREENTVDNQLIRSGDVQVVPIRVLERMDGSEENEVSEKTFVDFLNKYGTEGRVMSFEEFEEENPPFKIEDFEISDMAQLVKNKMKIEKLLEEQEEDSESNERVKDELFSSEEMDFDSMTPQEDAKEVDFKEWRKIVEYNDLENRRASLQDPEDRIRELKTEIAARRYSNILMMAFFTIVVFMCYRFLVRYRNRVRELEYSIERLHMLSPDQRAMIERCAKPLVNCKQNVNVYDNLLADKS